MRLLEDTLTTMPGHFEEPAQQFARLASVARVLQCSSGNQAERDRQVARMKILAQQGEANANANAKT